MTPASEYALDSLVGVVIITCRIRSTRLRSIGNEKILDGHGLEIK